MGAGSEERALEESVVSRWRGETVFEISGGGDLLWWVGWDCFREEEETSGGRAALKSGQASLLALLQAVSHAYCLGFNSDPPSWRWSSCLLCFLCIS